MEKYVLSWHRDEFVTGILHPRWWQFWKRAVLVRELKTVRYALTDIPKDEADVLIATDFQATTNGRLLTRLMGPRACGLQLESLPGADPFIKSLPTPAVGVDGVPMFSGTPEGRDRQFECGPVASPYMPTSGEARFIGKRRVNPPAYT